MQIANFVVLVLCSYCVEKVSHSLWVGLRGLTYCVFCKLCVVYVVFVCVQKVFPDWTLSRHVVFTATFVVFTATFGVFCFASCVRIVLCEEKVSPGWTSS